MFYYRIVYNRFNKTESNFLNILFNITDNSQLDLVDNFNSEVYR